MRPNECRIHNRIPTQRQRAQERKRGFIGAITGAIGLGSAISGLVGGGGGGSPYTGTQGGSGTNFYIPNNLSGQDTNFQNQQSYITGQSPWPTISPMYQNLMQQGYNDPYAINYQNAGTQAGQQYGNFVAPTLGAAGATYDAGGLIAGAQDLYKAAATNPYTGAALSGAQTGGGMLQQGALADTQAAGTLMPYATGAAATLQGGANAVLGTAFDPQGALYAQQFQQNTDQTRAGLEARGLDTSAAGQGIENQSNQNFNIAWQNAQLGRQTQGLSTASSALGQGVSGLTSGASTAANLYGTAGNQYAAGAAMPYNLQNQYYNNLIGDYGNVGSAAGNYANLDTTAAGLANTGVGFNLNAGATPYNTSQTIMGNQGTALNNYQNAYQTAMTPYQQSLANSQAYMGLGTQAQNAYASAQQRAWQQGQTSMYNMGSGMTGLANNVKSLYNTFNTPSPSYSSGYTDQFGSGTQGYNPGYNAAPVGTGNMYTDFAANGGFNTTGAP